MPVYELVLLIQKLEREALKQALKRTANYIFEEDGVIRKIENLGFRNLPFSISAKGKNHKVANYFIVNYDGGASRIKSAIEKLKLDVDVVRASNFVVAKTPTELYNKKPKPECTLHVDLLPAPSRPTVIALQEIATRKKMSKRHIGRNTNDTDFKIC